MIPSNADPIARIREFASRAAGGFSATVQQGIPTAADYFASNAKPPRRRSRRGTPHFVDAEPSVFEMGRVAGRFGFVVRVDGDAQSKNRPAVKLFRFKDRSKPAATFVTFAEAMRWLVQEPGRPE